VRSSLSLVRTDILGDVAEIISPNPEVAEQLRTIAPVIAPEVGALRELAKEKIALAIAAAGFAIGNIELEAPPIATVKTRSTDYRSVLVRAAVERVTLSELQSKGAYGAARQT